MTAEEAPNLVKIGNQSLVKIIWPDSWTIMVHQLEDYDISSCLLHCSLNNICRAGCLSLDLIMSSILLSSNRIQDLAEPLKTVASCLEGGLFLPVRDPQRLV